MVLFPGQMPKGLRNPVSLLGPILGEIIGTLSSPLGIDRMITLGMLLGSILGGVILTPILRPVAAGRRLMALLGQIPGGVRDTSSTPSSHLVVVGGRVVIVMLHQKVGERGEMIITPSDFPVITARLLAARTLGDLSSGAITTPSALSVTETVTVMPPADRILEEVRRTITILRSGVVRPEMQVPGMGLEHGMLVDRGGEERSRLLRGEALRRPRILSRRLSPLVSRHPNSYPIAAFIGPLGSRGLAKEALGLTWSGSRV